MDERTGSNIEKRNAVRKGEGKFKGLGVSAVAPVQNKDMTIVWFLTIITERDFFHKVKMEGIFCKTVCF